MTDEIETTAVRDLEPIFDQVKTGDPIGAAYRLAQMAGTDEAGRFFYEAGSIALSRRDELGDDALRFARILFAEAVERDPELSEAHHDLATTMRELGMSEDAIAHYRRALELAPNDADAMIGLGASQCDAGRLDESIASLKKATKAHPHSGQAFANLGIALEAADRIEESVGAYAKAVARFDANLAEAQDDETAAEAAARRRFTRIQMAALLEQLGRWPQAIAEYRRLHEEEEALAEVTAHAEEANSSAEEDEESEEEPALSDVAGELSEEEGETLLDAEIKDATGEADEHQHDDPDEEAGRQGLGRVFCRFVRRGRLEMAFLLLDEMGGEYTDGEAGDTYTIYDPGDGFSTIMVERAGGSRKRLDLVDKKKKSRKAPKKRTRAEP